MTITTTTTNLTIDETAGLQNAIATPSPAGDANDNDIAIASLPSAFATRLTALGVAATQAAESGYDGSNTGANIVSVTPDAGGTITGLSFAKDLSGDPLPIYQDTTAGVVYVDTGFKTTSGREIFLFVDGTNNNIAYGVEGNSDGTANPSGNIAFAVYLDETKDASGNITGAKMWTVITEPLAQDSLSNTPDDSVDLTNKLFVAAEQSLTFNASNSPSGSNLFIMFAGSNATKAVVATGMQPANQSDGANISSGDTVSTSQVSNTTFGTNAQMIKPPSTQDPNGNGIWFTFVTNPNSDFTVPNLTPTEANVEANIQYGTFFSASEAAFDVVQLQSGKSAVVEITAVDSPHGGSTEDGTKYVDGVLDDFNNLSTRSVTITSVKLTGATNNGIFTRAAGNVTGVTWNADGSVTLSGILAGAHIDYTTAANHERVLIQNAGSGTGNGSAAFDVGGFQIVSVSTSATEVGSHVFFEDDGPTITASTTNEPTLTTTDPNSGSSSTANGAFGAQFTTNFGADGPAASNSKTFAFSAVSGVDSGVIDTATGQHVLLSGAGSQIVGTIDGGTTTVFTVSVDSTGNVTLVQSRAVVQGTGENPDIGETVGLSGNNKVVLNAMVTDGDADAATASLDLTPQLLFKDVGPTLTASATGEPTLTTTDPNSGSSSTANGAFGAQFTANFGADGPGASNSKTFAFSAVSGVDSGVIDTATGQHVLLSGAGSQIVGTIDGGTTTVFTVSVDSTGNVTLVQSRAVVQGTGENPDIGETVGLSGNNKVVLNARVTDGDADAATASLDLTPQLLFKDVGPTITASATGEPTLTTTDPNSGSSSTANDAFGAQFTANFGADGPGASNSETFAFSAVSGVDSGVIDTATGQHVLLSGADSQIVGTIDGGTTTVFTVSVDSTGNVTLVQSRAVVQGTGENPDIGETVGLSGNNKVVLNATVTDGDADAATASLDLTPQLLFTDVGPTITVANITNGTYTAGGSSTWSEAPNADGFKSLNVTLNDYTIDAHSTVTVNNSLGTLTTTDANGNYVFNGTINADFNGDGTSDAVAFKLTFNPGNDTYKIDVTTPPSTIINFDTSQGSLPAGGPQAVQSLTLSSGPEAGTDIVFFGAVATAPQTNAMVDSPPKDIEDLVGLGQPDLTKSQIDAFLGPPNQIPTLINPSTQMNVSTSGIGINNNNLDGSGAGIQSTDESFVVNPQLPVDKVTVFIDNSVGGYNPATEDLEYSVYFTDGTVTAPTKVQAGDLKPVTSGPAAGGKSFDISDVAGGPQIDAVQLTMANGTVKIPVIQFSIQQTFTPQPLNMNLTATLADGDADTSKHQFSIALA